MSGIRKSITFTHSLNDWVQYLVSKGDYANESEYVRDLIRRDKEKKSESMALRSAMEVGRKSGRSTQSVVEIFEEKRKEMKKDGRL